MTEWERLRMALVGHVEAGKTLGPVARRSGVSRATLLNWLANKEAPETIVKAQAVSDALRDT
jgi:transcriptional regulator with XRE-family HTH domain